MNKKLLLCIVLGFGVQIAYGEKNTKTSRVPEKKGRIIFVTGSCSSGKSSLARLIAQQLDAKFFAFDECVIPVLTRKMVEKEVGKVPAFFITKIFNGFTLIGFLSEKRKREAQIKFYDELKKGLAIGPTKRMYQDVRKLALAGCNVVVEAPLHLGDGVDCMASLSVLHDLDVSFVLAYCPWNNIVERIAARNQKSNRKNNRELDWAVGNFLHYFDISTDKNTGSIDTLSGRAVNNLVATYSRPEFKKKRMQICAETQQAAHSYFKTDGLHYLRPHLAYDLIINTQEHKPEEGAMRVLDFVKNKSSAKKFAKIDWVY
jgi:chloramphenicol 3-O-phosphotransferase